MGKRWLIAVALGLSLPVIGGGVAYVMADRTINDDRELPKVLAAAPGSLPLPPMAPYPGPHPRLSGRPPEHESFPLAIGELGPVQPLFAHPPRDPFLCRTVESDLGQPVVDNQEGIGMAVFAEDDHGEPTESVMGYSRDCRLPTRIHYWAMSASLGEFAPLASLEQHDIVALDLDGGSVPWVVRVETGSLHRHIYLIAILAGPDDIPEQPDLAHWNHRLVYYLRGGVGIGHRQGHTSIRSILRRRQDEISRGYAVAYSSANQTGTSYDIWLAEDTALRVKRQFVSAYGTPDYTVGIGGSGGAIQQYLFGQNHPGLLDAGIALYSYPDMVTQSIHILDCELLESYFDLTDADNPRWQSVHARAAIEGMNASAELAPRFWPVLYLSRLANGQWPPVGRGSTECTRSWRGMTPLVLNPHYAHFSLRFDPALAARVEWTYWADLAPWFGTDEFGHARRTWDNEGVQYGLQALRAGDLSPAEFLDLNRRIGSWKATGDMLPPRFFISEAAPSDLSDYDPWGRHNMRLEGDPAPRNQGDAEAIRGAWQSGQVFSGVIDMPVVDLRHYLEDELDMHHASASFSARLRIQRVMGDASHQLIWMTRRPHAPYREALEVIDAWLAARRDHPLRSLAQTRPPAARDRCWDHNGHVLAEGDGVWDGAWNGQPAGECLQHYPIFGTSRSAAGEGLAGDIFRCTRIGADQAVEDGLYAPVDMGPWRDTLNQVFPTGVCDPRKPGRDYPVELIRELAATVR